jgi:hypothetical protein
MNWVGCTTLDPINEFGWRTCCPMSCCPRTCCPRICCPIICCPANWFGWTIREPITCVGCTTRVVTYWVGWTNLPLMICPCCTSCPLISCPLISCPLISCPLISWFGCTRLDEISWLGWIMREPAKGEGLTTCRTTVVVVVVVVVGWIVLPIILDVGWRILEPVTMF